MMTAQRLVGLAGRGEWDALLGAVIANGRPVPLAVRMRLSDEAASGAAALGLALCRAVELTYLPGPEGADLASTLLSAQRADGWFGTPAATAAAIAGLRTYEHQLRAGGDDRRAARMAAASDAAMHALITRHRDGLGHMDNTDLAAVLWLLAGRTRADEAWWASEVRTEAEDRGLAHDAALCSIVTPALVRSRDAGRDLGVAA